MSAKILICSDNPAITTGMGRVHREIGRGLIKRGWRVSSLGWFTPLWLESWREWKVHSTNNNYYGSDVFDSLVVKVQPDIVITIGDIWMVRHIHDVSKTRSFFKWAAYLPIDGESWTGGVPSTWKPVIGSVDQPIAYTQYGKRKILHSLRELESWIKVIPHGVDTNVFKPLPPDYVKARRKEWGVDNKFVFLMVSRNQGRKNIPEFCKAWKKFKLQKGHEDCVFWPHMNFNDPMGWNLEELFTDFSMWNDIAYLDEIAHGAHNLSWASEEMLNVLYNICDVHILCSGEGFGLPTLEAMACGKPVINLDHSANTEITQGRGELVKVSHYITGHYSTERPFFDEDDLIEKMHRLVANEELRTTYGKEALKFARSLTWDKVLDQWDETLREIYDPMIAPRFMEVK